MIPNHIKISNIESNIIDFLSKNNYSKIGILVDNNSNKHCFPIIKKILKVPYSIIFIQSGEKEKNIKTCIKVWNSLTKLKFDRKSLLIEAYQFFRNELEKLDPYQPELFDEKLPQETINQLS